jgi:hypothetical protein
MEQTLIVQRRSMRDDRHGWLGLPENALLGLRVVPDRFDYEREVFDTPEKYILFPNFLIRLLVPVALFSA